MSWTIGTAAAVVPFGQTAGSLGLGTAVGLSADGTTLIAGAPGSATAPGPVGTPARVLVLTRLAAGFGASVAAFSGSAGGTGELGAAVALSRDGTGAVIGGPFATALPGIAGAGRAEALSLGPAGWESAPLAQVWPALGDQIGQSVSISGDGRRIIVGAGGDDVGGVADVGAAWLYERFGDVWERRNLPMPEAPARALYGAAVAMAASGEAAIVGGRFADVGANLLQGAAWLWRIGPSTTHWTRLVAASGAAGDQFGTAVAISADGRVAAVGAPGRDGAEENQGGLHVFRRIGATWTETVIAAPDPVRRGGFGTSVAMSEDGTMVLAGAPRAGATGVGAAYLFRWERTAWVLQRSFAGDGSGTGQFGLSVGLSGAGYTAVVGAPGEQAADDPAPGGVPAGQVWTYATAQPAPMFWRASGGAIWMQRHEGGRVIDARDAGAAPAATAAGLGRLAGADTDGILWQEAGGALTGWVFHGGVRAETLDLGTAPAGWTLLGLADLSGDGIGDLLWRRDADGVAGLWLMGNRAVARTAEIGSPGAGWTLAGTGDLDGDGRNDLVWREDATGAALFWRMEEERVLAERALPAAPAGAVLLGAGDGDGDGRDDLIWRRADGMIEAWRMDADTVLSTSVLGWRGAEWQAIRLADLSGDGRADLVWRHAATGRTEMWALGPGAGGRVVVAQPSLLPNLGTGYAALGNGLLLG
ncbi:MAG: VCBS repeat-containing protein [Alphaproteobacteria bacterium]|nr:VCBS repeat-containing protein [Alphaproteobacteria bacterium]